MKIKTRVSRFLVTLFVFSILLAQFIMPLNAYAAPDYATVRVKLSNANDGTLNITLNGYYQLNNENARVNGDVLIEMQSDDTITLTQKSNGQVLYSGKSFTLSRNADQSGKPGLFKMYTTAHGWRQYLGNLQISVSGGKFLVVNQVPMEHYLYGVVAYEMSNTFPLDALKAQAIAARGYVAGRIGTYSKYDLGDTPSDQVYKGYDPQYATVIQAVDETRGEILTYNNRVVLPYYAASNGGQTELTGNIWSQSLAYCKMIDDPYDLRNPSSLKQTIFFPETVSSSTPLNAKLESFLKVQVAPELEKQGFSAFSDQIQILGIQNLEATDAKYPAPSRSFTMAKANIVVNAVEGSGGAIVENVHRGEKPEKPVFTSAGVNSANGPLYRDQNGNLCDAATMQWYLDQYEAALLEWEQGNTVLEDSGQGMSGNIKKLTIPIKFTIYDLKDKNRPYRLFTNDNLRMYWSESVNGGANLVNVRYGHGVGMSQRGAQQMAVEGKSYRDILNFYYDSCEIQKYDYTTPTGTIDVSKGVNPETTPEPGNSVPLPTDSTDNPIDGLVEVANSDSTVIQGIARKQTNLFASSTAKKPLGALKSGSIVHVLAQQGNQFLIATKSGVVAFTAIADVAVDSAPAVVLKDTNGYALPSGTEKAAVLKKGVALSIVERNGKMYRVALDDGLEVYVPIEAVNVVVDNPQIPLSSKKQYGLTTKKAILYSDTKKKKKIATVASNTVLVVTAKAADKKHYVVTYNGKKAYIAMTSFKVLKKGSMHPNPKQVISQYIRPTVATTKSNASLAMNAIPNPSVGIDESFPTKNIMDFVNLGKQPESLLTPVQHHIVAAFPANIKGQTVNVRQLPSTSSKIVTQLPGGEPVSVLGQSGDFYKIVTTTGITGYVAKSFVSLEDANDVGHITGDGVNLRKTASTSSAVLMALTKGDTVTILETSGAFFKVKTFSGVIGYVADLYCVRGAVTIPTITSPSAGSDTSGSTTSGTATNQTPAKPASPKAAASGVISVNNINMRKSPSMTAPIIAIIPSGTRVNIFSKNNGFYKISYNGMIGYVSMDFIPKSTLAAPVTGSGVVT